MSGKVAHTEGVYMFHRDLVLAFMTEQELPAEEMATAVDRMKKHDHQLNDTFGDCCLADIFLSAERKAAFLVWAANPTSFIEAVEGGAV